MPVSPNFKISLFVLGCLFVLTSTSYAQTFSSGSTGADGPLTLTTPGTYDFDPKARNLDPEGDNIFHFTTVTIGTGVTLRLSNKFLNGPVYWLAQGAVVINGTLDLSGESGLSVTDNSSDRIAAAGGAGGYSGGLGGNSTIPPTPGNGPGGSPATTTNQPVTGISFGGTFTGNQYLVPLIGGSGGGGTVPACRNFGAGGGGGGGAILIASSASITLTGGTINAAGGNGGSPCSGVSPGGSGGAIRLIAPNISTSGTVPILNVNGGGFQGGAGRIRLEGYSVNINTGNTDIRGPFSISVPFKLALPSTPPSAIRVTSLVVGGTTIPINANPFSFPDATISSTGPVTVNVQAQYIPVGTTAKIFVASETGPDQTINCSTPLQGSLQQSTCSAQVTFVPGGSRGFVKATW